MKRYSPQPSQFFARLIERTANGNAAARTTLELRVAELERRFSIAEAMNGWMRELGRRVSRIAPGVSPYSTPSVIACEVDKLVDAEQARRNGVTPIRGGS